MTYQAQDMFLSSVHITAVGKGLKFIAQEGTKAPKRGVMRNNNMFTLQNPPYMAYIDAYIYTCVYNKRYK